LSELERNDKSFHNHCRTKACSEAQKEHRAAPVASQCLHGRIIDDPYRTLEGGLEIETYPALCKVAGLSDRPIEADRPGIPDGHHVILPVFSQFFHAGNHGLRSQFWARFKLLSLVFSRSEYLHMSSADINCQHIHNSFLVTHTSSYSL